MPRGYVQGATAAATKLDNIFFQLEQDILADIVRQVSAAGKITDLADWQVNRLNMLGQSSQTIRANIQAATGKSQSQMSQLYNDAAQSTYVRDASLFNATGRQQTPYAQNYELQQLVRAITAQTNSQIDNLTKSTGFMLRNASGRLQFTPVSDVYNKYLDQNMTALLTGAFDYNTMIRKTVQELTSSGLRSVDYANGRSNRIDVAVRRALLTGYGQLTGQVTFSNGQALGTDSYEVAWHPGARPDHQVWQGKVWTRRQLETVCGYGTVTGLCGANCRHVFYPWVEGVRGRQWSDAELAALDAKENTPKTYRGKDYTTYEATQHQRKLETAMRAYLERGALFEIADIPQDDEMVVIASAKLRALKQQYKDFSKFFKLPEQWERVGLTAA